MGDTQKLAIFALIESLVSAAGEKDTDMCIRLSSAIYCIASEIPVADAD